MAKKYSIFDDEIYDIQQPDDMHPSDPSQPSYWDDHQQWLSDHSGDTGASVKNPVGDILGVSGSDSGSVESSITKGLFNSANLNQILLQSLNNAASKRLWRKQADFNHAEAALERDWQERMSNTAHQREMADLRAAGLNPLLTAVGSPTSGASSSAGAAATASAPQVFGAESNKFIDLTMALVSGLTKVINAVKK